MTKKELRKEYLKKRLALSVDEVNFLSRQISENFFLQFKPSENQSVHVFLSIEKFNEINTKIFIEEFFKKKMRVFVPKMIGEKLISVELKENTLLAKNKWDILEPVSHEDCGVQNFDYVITPLLYCDKKGNRVGYGKGFYDKFFAQLDENSKKIGVNYFPPNDIIDDVEPTDIPLDYLATPVAVLSFGIGTSNATK